MTSLIVRSIAAILFPILLFFGGIGLLASVEDDKWQHPSPTPVPKHTQEPESTRTIFKFPSPGVGCPPQIIGNKIIWLCENGTVYEQKLES